MDLTLIHLSDYSKKSSYKTVFQTSFQPFLNLTIVFFNWNCYPCDCISAPNTGEKNHRKMHRKIIFVSLNEHVLNLNIV